jgi:hypothetical protein
VFDLADSLAGDVERSRDLLERAGLLVAEAVAQFDHASPPVGEVLERVAQRFVCERLHRALIRGFGLLVGDQLAERAANRTGA